MTPEGIIKKQVKEILSEVGAWYCMASRQCLISSFVTKVTL